MYISRAMSPTEQRYTQIEKEALDLTWACERFQDFLVGLNFQIETDHKPLVPLFSSKLLDELPLHVQRFRMRMMRFSFSILHTASLRAEMLALPHASYQGISKTRERARQSVWWLRMSEELEGVVRMCPECTKSQTPRAEPLVPTALPELPWQKVATDLFEWKKANYLLIVDYYSRWIEITKLEQTISNV